MAESRQKLPNEHSDHQQQLFSHHNIESTQASQQHDTISPHSQQTPNECDKQTGFGAVSQVSVSNVTILSNSMTQSSKSNVEIQDLTIFDTLESSKCNYDLISSCDHLKRIAVSLYRSSYVYIKSKKRCIFK